MQVAVRVKQGWRVLEVLTAVKNPPRDLERTVKCKHSRDSDFVTVYNSEREF